jgi:hypothetical protein
MGIKVFVSYKHNDNSVKNLTGYHDNTVRDYVDYLMDKTLKDKIHDSSITLVLISPDMKDPYQWIPWEISYSLKEITRKDKTSHTNGMLAVVLPDVNGNYDYFIENKSCNCRALKTGILFQILNKNMFNANDLQSGNCNVCNSNFYSGDSSYITSVKWRDFISNKDGYLDKAVKIRDDRKSYTITKEV